MLSHVNDERYFRGSNDLIFSSSHLKEQSRSKQRSSSITRHIKKTKSFNSDSNNSDGGNSSSSSSSGGGGTSNSNSGSSADIEDQDQDEPHFSQVQPYYRSSQLRAMAAKYSSPLRRPRDYHPEKISLVYLPTGEIRPKETMVPRLLTHDSSLQQKQKHFLGSTEKYQAEKEEEDEEKQEHHSPISQQKSQEQKKSSKKNTTGNKFSTTTPNTLKNSLSPEKTKKNFLSSSQIQLTELKRSRIIHTPSSSKKKSTSSSSATTTPTTLPSRLEILEKQISKEKERLLSKMTQVLEEQEKNQVLQKEKQEIEQTFNEQKKFWTEQIQLQEKTHEKLQEQIKVKEELQKHLENDLKQLKNTCQMYQQEMNDCMEQMTLFFHTMHHHLKKKLLTLPTFDTKWISKYPRLKEAHEQLEATFKQHVPPLQQNAHTLEQELEQLHAKYVELKELCARQCVREADLQNFINEHRLKGNLVIPVKTSYSTGSNSITQQAQEKKERSRGLLKRTTIPTTTKKNPHNRDRLTTKNKQQLFEISPATEFNTGASTSSAMLNKIEQKKAMHNKSANQKIERIKLVPSSKLSKQYERNSTPKATTTTAAAAIGGSRSSVTRATTVSSRANDIREFTSKNSKSISSIGVSSSARLPSSRPSTVTAMSRSRIPSKTSTTKRSGQNGSGSTSSSNTITKTSLLRPWN